MSIWNTPRPIRAIFFDVDGTLLSFKDHRVPETTLMALAELKRKGVMCFLATGRPPYQLEEISIDNFEAFILFNGQLCLTRDEVFFDEFMDRGDIATVIDQVDQGLYECLFMEKGRCYVSGHNDDVCAIEEATGQHFQEGDIHQALHNDIYQLNVFLHPGETGVVTDATEHLKLTRWSPHFVDAFPRHGGKHAAVRRMLQRYGLDADEAAAFGDGGNDVSMLSYVPLSFAVSGATRDAKDAARYLIGACEDDAVPEAIEALVQGEMPQHTPVPSHVR